jgi:hypothetical protein
MGKVHTIIENIKVSVVELKGFHYQIESYEQFQQMVQ